MEQNSKENNRLISKKTEKQLETMKLGLMDSEKCREFAQKLTNYISENKK